MFEQIQNHINELNLSLVELDKLFKNVLLSYKDIESITKIKNSTRLSIELYESICQEYFETELMDLNLDSEEHKEYCRLQQEKYNTYNGND